MGRARVLLAVAIAACVCGGSASAAGSSAQELTIEVSDGTTLACGLVLPSGSPPAGGWPGLLLFHGLGQTHAFMETIATAVFAPAGFASLACDTRGTGDSGGTFGLAGPKEVQDARDLFNWLAARSDVSDTQIGAFGLSLGGGVVWNAAVAGVPFKAIVPATTWTDLGAALNPNGVPKSGLVAQLASAVPFSQWDPSLTEPRALLLSGAVTAAVKSMEAARSSRSRLHSLTVPTLLLQGRRDFLFDLDQAIAAYKLLGGPKRLYLGDLGHPPATNPASEVPTYLGEAVAWFERYLAGGAAVPGGVEIADDPWDGTTTTFRSLPATRQESVNLPGSKKLGKDCGTASRSVRLPGGPLETFGDGYVSVRYSGRHLWTGLIATVAIKGGSTPVTVGAARLKKQAGVLRIPLSDQAALLPRGKRLVVTVGGRSAGGVYGTPLCGAPPPNAAPAITIGRVTLTLSLLEHTLSK
ncbi:MAG TPA: CocE/NonD family hydrolase [Gaiellaceae bacterium]|nr:CocE/NonD family hydrolase [Gaiellaceae bacterium]